MATLPPRKNLTPTKISKEYLTPLEILLQLGFPKNRAEKALAATGHRGVQLASDWLLAHVRDPNLDDETSREYIVYLCPTGLFAQKLAKFFIECKELGWNKAHNYIPHLTMLRFFKVPDELAKQVANLFETLIDIKNDCIERIDFETYISPNFMGLFVDDHQANYLDNIAKRFINKLSSLDINADIHTDSLHLSLAYQFSVTQFQLLRSMVERMGKNSSSNWELRLYSRNAKLKDLRVHKVTHAHVPREDDELELRPGDFIYITDDACDESIDGWVKGVSWLTGLTGYLPMNHTERTAETDAWTLHATVTIPNGKIESSYDNIEIPKTRKPPILSPTESIDTPDGIAQDNEVIEASLPPSITSREIYICRHGERVDFTFGAWIPYCFDENGTYVRRDLNMPREIPTRLIQDFQNDSPLTTLGEMQASLVGEAMKSSNVKIDVAFTSPSLRCIQTCSKILKGQGSNLQMKIEPGFIEWLAWYPNGLPVWMSTDDLIKAGFNVDKNYEAIVSKSSLIDRESAAQYYERSYELVKKIIDSTEGNILIVGHAASLGACTRQLSGGNIPTPKEVTRLVQRVPYLACLTARQDNLHGWQLNPPPFPPITHSSNSRFDWKMLH